MTSQERAERAITDLLDQRGPSKTICPSEAARALAGPDGDWRAQMDVIHHTVDAMVADERIALSWQGEPMDRRRGAYRIARR